MNLVMGSCSKVFFHYFNTFPGVLMLYKWYFSDTTTLEQPKCRPHALTATSITTDSVPLVLPILVGKPQWLYNLAHSVCCKVLLCSSWGRILRGGQRWPRRHPHRHPGREAQLCPWVRRPGRLRGQEIQGIIVRGEELPDGTFVQYNYKCSKFMKKLWHLCGLLMTCSNTCLRLNLLSI